MEEIHHKTGGAVHEVDNCESVHFIMTARFEQGDFYGCIGITFTKAA
jgi:hypothetical protein